MTGMFKVSVVSTLAILGILNPAIAQQSGVSKYAGQEAREIKSLSPDDIAQLKSGAGWGLARSAELNGVPGPAHLLELKDQIPLRADQIIAIKAISAELKIKAIAEGKKLIELERQLGTGFRDKSISDSKLRQLLDQISNSRSNLRYIHLSTHLTTPPLLTSKQIARYNKLRGYGGDDPCANVPEGHDPKMWKKMNNCT